MAPRADTVFMLQAAINASTAPARVALPEAAFLFADIARFTAYTEIHGDARAAELAWRMRLGVEGQLGDDAHVVKTLGDAVMVRIADPAEAAAAGLRIVARALPAAGDPPVRVGIHCGPAIESDGDFIGAAVNLAARVAALAGPGEVLLTADVAGAARGHGLWLEEFGEHKLRNVASPVLLYSARERLRTCGGGRGAAPDCAPRRLCRDRVALGAGKGAANVRP
jgi:adenylate cyclase